MRWVSGKEMCVVVSHGLVAKCVIGLLLVSSMAVLPGCSSGRSSGAHRIARAPTAHIQRFCSERRRFAQVPGTHAKLLINSHRVTAGDRVFVRLANTGTRSLGFGFEFHTERFVHGRWRGLGPIKVHGTTIVSPSVLVFLAPGRAHECIWIALSQKWPKGRYRVAQKASLRQGAYLSHSMQLYAYFRLLD